MRLGRAEVEPGRAVYAVSRPDWEAIGRAIGLRLILILALASIGSVLTMEGFFR